MVLAGIVLALVVLVDDAVVTADTMRHHLERVEGEGGEVATARRFILGLVRRGGRWSTPRSIALLALIPIFVLTGETGAFLPPLALSYGAAVVASLVVALTVAPALAMLLLPAQGARNRRSSPVESVAPAALRPARRPGSYARPAPGSSSGSCCSWSASWLIPVLDRHDSLVPEFKDRDVLVRLTGARHVAPGDGPPSARRAVSLTAIPGVGKRRWPRRPRHARRPDGRHQLRRALGAASSTSADYDDTLSSIEGGRARSTPASRPSCDLPTERIDTCCGPPTACRARTSRFGCSARTSTRSGNRRSGL